jgi:hypothetical protein
MNALPYRQAFDRLRAEFLEMPGMRLSPEQVARLSGVPRDICQCVLEDLVRAGFLRRWSNGSYGRSSDALTARARLVRDPDQSQLTIRSHMDPGRSSQSDGGTRLGRGRSR